MASSCWLLVNSDSTRAIRCCRRNGFVEAGEDVNPNSGRPGHGLDSGQEQLNSAEQHPDHQHDIGDGERIEGV